METNILALRGGRDAPCQWVALILVWCSFTAHAESIDARIVVSDNHGLTLDLSFPPALIEPVPGTGGTWQHVSVSGASFKQTLGQPELPQYGVLIGVPDGVQLTLTELDAVADEEISGIRVVPSILQLANDPLLPWQRIEQTLNASTYSLDAWFPSALASVGFQGRLRGQAVAQILFHPVSYHPMQQAIRAYRTLRVRVDFDRPLVDTAASAMGVEHDDLSASPGPAFESIIRNSLINHSQLGR